MPNKDLAPLLFQPTLQQSHELFVAQSQLFFHNAIPLTTLAILLDRKSCDTSISYVCSVVKDILSGGDMYAGFELEDILALLRDPTQPPLINVLSKTSAEMVRDRGQEVLNKLPQGISSAMNKQTRNDIDMRLGIALAKQMDQLEKTKNVPATTPMVAGFVTESESEDDEESESFLDDFYYMPDTPLSYSVSDEEEEHEFLAPQAGGGGVVAEVDWIWIPNNVDIFSIADRSSYSWLFSVWIRVNFSQRYANAFKRKFSRSTRLEQKVENYVYNAHLQCILYLESLADPCDAHVDADRLCSLYKGMGKSMWVEDLEYGKETKTVHQIKDTPLTVIRAAYPNDPLWTPEDVAVALRNKTLFIEDIEKLSWINGEWAPFPAETLSVETHSLYLGILYIFDKCQREMAEHSNESLYDSLWAYYCSFTELFFFCLSRKEPRMDDLFLLSPLDESTSSGKRGGGGGGGDKASPWELYGTMDTRAFHAGDLPDVYHVLASIPLWGELNTPKYSIGRILQKSLPFVCQRRMIVMKTIESCQAEHGFFLLVARLFWVMMAGLYPGIMRASDNHMGMRELIRIYELTLPTKAGKERLLDIISRKDKNKSGPDGGPILMVVLYRLYIIYMGLQNPLFIETASKCINWSQFQEQTLYSAYLIRQTSFFPDDVFAQARNQLSKFAKNPKVHRLRSMSLAMMINHHLKGFLGTVVLADYCARKAMLTELQNLSSLTLVKERFERFCAIIKEPLTFQEDNKEKVDHWIEHCIHVTKESIAFWEKHMAFGCKGNIVNLLIRMLPGERLTVKAFSCLTQEKYGGITKESVGIMSALINVYYSKDKAIPSEFERHIGLFNLRDLFIVCFYFNTVCTLEQITLVPLDADTVRQTDLAMLHYRNKLYPGQEIPKDIYTVGVALCCQKICTFFGRGNYGYDKVAYDMEEGAFVCTKGKRIERNATQRKIQKELTVLSHDPHQEEEEAEDEEDDDDDDDDEEDEEDEEDENDEFIKQMLARKRDLLAMVDPTSMYVQQSVVNNGRGDKKHKKMETNKVIRTLRRHFYKIPCGESILHIDLRGFSLVWGNKLSRQVRYMFCPKGGEFHRFSSLNFINSETVYYRCGECAADEVKAKPFKKCAYCGKTNDTSSKRVQRCLPVFLDGSDPCNPQYDLLIDPEKVYQTLYFCETHYNIAKYYNYRLPKSILWKKIQKVHAQKLRKYAIKTSMGLGKNFH